MSRDEIPYDRVRHLLRTGDRSPSVAGGKASNFDDVASFIFEGSSHLVERVFRRLAQYGLPRMETDLSLPACFELIEPVHHLFCRRYTRRNLVRRRLRRLCLAARVARALVRKVHLLRSKAQSLLRAAINILNL